MCFQLSHVLFVLFYWYQKGDISITFHVYIFLDNGAVKNIIHRSLPSTDVGHRLRKRRIRSASAYCPSYCSESFELHKILRAVRKGQFSAPAKLQHFLKHNKSKFLSIRFNIIVYSTMYCALVKITSYLKQQRTNLNIIDEETCILLFRGAQTGFLILVDYLN